MSVLTGARETTHRERNEHDLVCLVLRVVSVLENGGGGGMDTGRPAGLPAEFTANLDAAITKNTCTSLGSLPSENKKGSMVRPVSEIPVLVLLGLSCFLIYFALLDRDDFLYRGR